MASRRTPAQRSCKKRASNASPAVRVSAAKRLKAFDAILREQATCPVCSEVNSPMFVCGAGHIVCGACKDQLELPLRCPTCRLHMPEPSRNRGLEAFAETLKTLPCKWSASTAP